LGVDFEIMFTKNSNNSNFGRATLIIAVFSLLAKILGLVRDAVFSHQFGAGTVIDAYFAAFRVPDFIYNLLILGTFSVAFIPVFSEYLITDKQKADRLVSSITNVTLLMVLLLTVLAFIFINPLVSTIAPGFVGEAYELTKLFTMIFLISPLLLTLSSIVSSILNTYKKFTLVAIAPVIYNLSIIAGAIWFYPLWGARGLAYGVVLGALLHFIIQLPQVFRLGFRYSFAIDWADAGFRKYWRLYWPRIFSMGTSQITALIVSIFGSFLGTGALASFYYANNLQAVALSLFAVSFAIAAFPLLSDLYNKKDILGFKDVIAKTAIQILFFMIPISILMLVLRAQIVRLVLGIGQSTNFTFTDTSMVARALGLFAISLFAQSLIPLFTRAFYALQNTIIPVVIGFMTIFVNLIFTFWLSRRLGISGMVLAFSISSVINLILLIVELHRKLGNVHDEYLIINTLKIVISSLVAGAATFVSLYVFAPIVDMRTYWGVLVQGGAAALIGTALYLTTGWGLGLSESHNLINLLRITGKKLGRPINIIWNWF